MVVLAAFPGTRGAGVPFRHVKTTAVARIPIVPFFVWVRGTITISAASTSAPSPPEGGGVEYQEARCLEELTAPLGS